MICDVAMSRCMIDRGMAIELENAVPWGRSFGEYRRMFRLTKTDLATKRIIDVAAGPSSFNAELHALGHPIVSVDPLYSHSATDIRRRIDETYPTIVEGCRRDAHRFVWKEFRDPNHLGQRRMTAMGTFLADYELGKSQGRYLSQSLPDLDFPRCSFDLALCSHFLFLYSDQLSETFHLSCVAGLCRIAKEVRVFPLLDLSGRGSRHLRSIFNYASYSGIKADVRRVPYEFMRGARDMLVLRPTIPLKT
jgi:hypothetical protein